MPTTPHVETHFTAGLLVRDVVIGMADGLTVPFALAAGLSGAVSSTRLILIGGLAEIAAGSIAMGLGGYLAAKGDAEHYEQEKRREEREIVEIPEAEKAEIEELFEQYGLTEAVGLLRKTRREPGSDQWVSLSGADPLNLVGILTPGPRLAALTGNRLVYRDGVPIAVLSGGKVQFLVTLDAATQWETQNRLLRSAASALMADLA